MAKRDYSDIAYWKGKIARMSEKAFHPHVGKHAITILENLHGSNDGIASGPMARDLAISLKVPKKYVIRSLALLARPGLIVITRENGWHIRLRRTGKTKEANTGRIGPSPKERSILLEMEKHRCGHCGLEFSPRELQVDHIVPLAMLGADEPGNWGTLCRSCNRDKWHNFDRDWLKHFRGKDVVGTIGVRLRGQELWPRINGKIQTMTRARMLKQAAP